jgi:hypothetical protein
MVRIRARLRGVRDLLRPSRAAVLLVRGAPDENEERAQRMVDAIELADEPRDLPTTRERPPNRSYGEPRPWKPNPYFQKMMRRSK